MWQLIPPVVMADERLSGPQRELYAKILSDSGSFGACFLTDFEFSEFMDTSEMAVRRHIKALESYGLIEDTDHTEQRALVPDFSQFPLIAKNFSNLSKKLVGLRGSSRVRNKDNTNDTYDTSLYDAYNEHHEEHMLQSTYKQINKFSDELTEVFDYWNTHRIEVLEDYGMNVRTSQFTSSRRSAVKSRLENGRAVEEIKKAIDGCLSSEFHITNGFTDLSLICRNDEKLNMFIARAENAVRNTGPELKELS